MEFIIEMLSKINVGELLVIGAMFWFFNTRLDKKFDKVERRFDKNELELKEVRTSINRIEGALLSKDCCMLNDKKASQKAE